MQMQMHTDTEPLIIVDCRAFCRNSLVSAVAGKSAGHLRCILQLPVGSRHPVRGKKHFCPKNWATV